MAQGKKDKEKSPKGMEHLIGLMNGLQEFHLIRAGIQLGLFDFLATKASTTDELAGALGFEKEVTQAWCEAATACGYLQIEDRRFNLTNWSKMYLDSTSTTYIGYLCKYATIIPEAYSDIQARFTGKRPLMETQHALETVKSIAPIAKMVVPILIQSVPVLKEKCHVLDLGTGLGSYLITMALANPNLTGLGVDGGWIAEIVYEARRNVLRHQVQDRIRILLADVLDLELTEKFDIVFMSGFLQAFNHENALTILKKAKSWLKPTGKLILQEMLLEEGRMRPKANALLNLLLRLETPQAGLFEYHALERLLLETHFTDIKKLALLPQITHLIAY